MEELYKKIRDINNEYAKKQIEMRDSLMLLRIAANKAVKEHGVTTLKQLDNVTPVSVLLEELEALISHDYINKLRNK